MQRFTNLIHWASMVCALSWISLSSCSSGVSTQSKQSGSSKLSTSLAKQSTAQIALLDLRTASANVQLRARAASSTEIDLTWSSALPTSGSFTVYRWVSGSSLAPVALRISGTSLADQALLPQSKYIYQVCFADGSTCSFALVATTLDDFKSATRPAPPSSPSSVPISDFRNNLFYAGEAVNFHFANSAATYEVRDFYGHVVASGQAGPSVQLPVSEPGWYRLFAFGRAGSGNGAIDGATNFMIFRNDPRFYPRPADKAEGRNGGVDDVLRGIAAIGPERMAEPNQWFPSTQEASISQQIQSIQKYYLNPRYQDPARPRDMLMGMHTQIYHPECGPWGPSCLVPIMEDTAALESFASTFAGFQGYYEGENEPNISGNGKYSNPASYAQIFFDFARTMRKKDPTAKFMGPATVDLTSGSMQYIHDFLVALAQKRDTNGNSGLSYLDAFSFHAYNVINGDPVVARSLLSQLQGILDQVASQYNYPTLSTIPKWQTEQGQFNWLDGIHEPVHSGRWDMIQFMLFEQFNIPKEHNNLWSDMQAGFGTFWEDYNTQVVEPAPALLRVYSEELFGKSFAQAVDFGNPGNNLYIGNVFASPDKSRFTLAVMTAAMTDGSLMLKGSPNSNLHLVSAFGVESDLRLDASGYALLPVGELPTYVEYTSSQALQVVKNNDLGANLALQPGVSVTASDHSDASKIIDGALNTSFGGGTDGYYGQAIPSGGSKDDSIWVEMDFPFPQSIATVVVYAGIPWQIRSSLTDYDLQVEQQGQWITVEHVQEDPKTLPLFAQADQAWIESFYSERSIFVHSLPIPITTQKLRLVVHDASYGGGGSRVVCQHGGQCSGSSPDDYHRVYIREIEAYGSAGASANLPVRINAGQTYSGNSGNPGWSSDIYANGGSLYDWGTSACPDPAGVTRSVYSSVHYSSSQFSYSLPVQAGGTYELKLHFCEGTEQNLGKSPFRVTVDSSTLLDHFDVGAVAGGAHKPYVAKFQVAATSDRLQLGFINQGSDGNLSRAMVSGIELSPLSLPIPKATPSIGPDPGPSSSPSKSSVPVLPTPSPSPTISHSPSPVGVAVRVHASANTYRSPFTGSLFDSDKYFTGGSAWGFSNITPSGTLELAELLVNVRYSTDRFRYALPVSAGASYQLNLYFLEGDSSKVGKSPMKINLNGATVLSQFDIGSAAGGVGKAIMMSFSVIGDASGILNVDFVNLGASDGQTRAMVSALELVPNTSNSMGSGDGSTGNPPTAATVSPGTTTLRIKAGGGSIQTASNGLSWTDDQAAFSSGGSSWTFTGPVQFSSDSDLYREVRYSSSKFSYVLPAVAGAYNLKLHFYEGDGGKVGQSQFNVTANGAVLLDQFDIGTAAGGAGKALVKSFGIVLENDGLKLNFQNQGARAMVSAIELVPASTALPKLATSPANNLPSIRSYAGSSRYIDPITGATWSPDAVNAVGGAIYLFSNLGVAGNPSDLPLYLTVRFSSANFQSKFSIPAGQYQVTLYFYEGDSSQVGQSPFDVTANGNALLSAFDIGSAAGGAGKALKKTFNIQVGANGLTLLFNNLVAGHRAMVSGIEITP